MRRGAWVIWGGVVIAGCGGRPDKWDASLPSAVESIGLSGSVAVRDDPLDRILMLTSPKERGLATKALQVGKNVTHWEADPRRQRLFVLAAGVQPRRNRDDELPSITLVDGGRPGLPPFVVARYTLSDPPSAIHVDPEGEYAVVMTGGGVVQNPNELLLLELPPADAKKPIADEGTALTAKTIRSFGSSPQAISFTPSMRFPDGERRLLIVQTEQEIALIDLAHPDQEVTVKLSEPLAGQVASKPLEVTFHDNQPDELGLPRDENRYPLIAIRMAGESTIPFLSFEPPSAAPADEDTPIETNGVGFQVTVNLAEARAVPSDIDFFWTEVNGAPEIRLAALLQAPVDGKNQAAMIDPIANRTEFVDVGAGYAQMTRITDEAATKSRTSDIALLWGPAVTSVAFWELGTTGSDGHRSIEAHQVGMSVQSVTAITRDDTAPEGSDYDFGHLKILQGAQANEFYVLDLIARQTSPMLTPTSSDVTIALAPDGQRAWVAEPWSTRFASLRFSDLHPTTLEVERPVTAVHDIAQADDVEQRAVLVLHGDGASLGVTVLDATDPDTADTRFYGGILLGGL